MMDTQAKQQKTITVEWRLCCTNTLKKTNSSDLFCQSAVSIFLKVMSLRNKI